MKILKVTGGYPPAFAQGGTATAAHSLMKALKKHGADVAVLTLNINGKERLEPSNGFVDYEVIPVWYCRGIHNLFMPYWSPEMIRTFEIVRSQFDIVLLDSSWTAYGPIIAKKCRETSIPYIVYTHGCVTKEKNILKGSLGLLKRKLWWQLFDRSMLNRSDGIVCITQQEKDFLLTSGVSSKIEVIPNGVDLEPISEVEADKIMRASFPYYSSMLSNGYFLFLGRIHPVKGLDVLLKAFSLLKESRGENDFPLLVCAGPDENNFSQKLLSLAKEFEIEDRIIFPGMLTGRNKQAIIRMAKCYILPSRSDVKGIATLEAMAYGVPVIVSEHCHFEELRNDSSGLIAELEPQSLCRAMSWILDNPVEANAMGERGQKLVNKSFTWALVAQKTIAFCESIIEGLTS